MTFRQLLDQLARRIGQHQLPLNSTAVELRGFIDSSAVHYELVTQVVYALYSGNRCQKLSDSVTRDATFAAIEPIRLALLRSPKTDVDAYALMEGICAELANLFKATSTPVSGGAPVTGDAQLYVFRRRLRFT